MSNYSKTVSVDELIQALEEEFALLKAQKDEKVRRLRAEHTWVPLTTVLRQRLANRSIRTVDKSASLFCGRLHAEIADLVLKGWITEDGQPRED